MTHPSNPHDQNPFVAPAPAAYSAGGYPPNQPNQLPMLLAVGSLITGLMGNLSCFCCLASPLSLLAVGLGVAALTQKPDNNAKVMAIVGVSLGGLVLLIVVAMNALAFLAAPFAR
jgi:hypothetical protein